MNDTKRESFKRISAYFFEVVCTLKHIQRTGWVKRGVSAQRDTQTFYDAESVGSHSWGISQLPMLFADIIADDVDMLKLTQMCISHEVGESRIGDITPKCGVSPEEKAQKEYNSVLGISNEFGLPEVLALFEELEACETIEAKLANDFDKIDMLLQVLYYLTGYRLAEDQNDFFSTFDDSDLHTEIAKEFVAFLREINSEVEACIATQS
ncbi:MAG TPA: hypothetical protein DCL21_05415 [Alphaproteobacteria bacterium]|nr:hypothetical protein [Alphaproteobacteria bacterium]